MKKINVLLILLSICTISFAQKTEWQLDKSHSSLGFSIDHMVISETVGKFDDYSMMVKADKADFTDAKFDVTIQVKSINTEDKKRDEHLISADLFDAAKYPTITFKGLQLKKVGSKYKAVGNFTMKGVTKKVEFDVDYRGQVKDPWGGTRAGLKLTGVIDRYQYGLEYNSLLEAGGMAIGKEVRITCNVELIKKA